MNSLMETMMLHAASIAHKPVNVLISDADSCSHTDCESNIYINTGHPIIKRVPEKERPVYIMGSFVHELMHVVFTDLKSACGVINKSLSDPAAQKTARLYFNLVCDPFVEYHASEVCGKPLINALRYKIRQTWILSGGIGSEESAYEQLINALIDFGDLGLIKGRFTFMEAAEAFKLIAPEMNRLIKDGSSKDRAEAAVRWTEATRSLWESGDDHEDMEKRIQSRKSGSPLEMPDETKSFDSDIDATESDGQGQADSEKEGREGKRSVKTEEAKRRDLFSEEMENGEAEAESLDGEDASKPSQGNISCPTGLPGAMFIDSESVDECRFDDLMLTEQDFLMAEALLQPSKESTAECDAVTDIPSRYLTSARCLNHYVHGDMREYLHFYDEIVSKRSTEIEELTRSLERILVADRSEEIRAMSGRYSLLRGAIGNTARICDRHFDDDSVGDFAILINFDISGSMHSSGKIDYAREAAIIVAESAAKLKLPVYIMGYTADTEGYDAVHYHYVRWTNTLEERHTLASMRAMANNADSFSIRFATKLLKKKKADNRILINVSDGLPACSKYKSMEDGLADTAAAIREAKNVASVIGIGLGSDCKPAKLHTLYSDHFIYIRDVSRLPAELAKLLKAVVRI